MVYGDNSHPPFKESDNTDYPLSLYAATKKFDEVMAHTYHHLYGMEMVGLRFFTTYGPWSRPDMAITQFVKRIDAGESIKVYDHGGIKRDFTYIDDIIDGVEAAINKDLNYELINLGSGKPVSLKELVEIIENNLGKKAKIEYTPKQPGDLDETLADISKAKKLLDYNSKYDIEEGIKKYINWYKNQYDNK